MVSYSILTIVKTNLIYTAYNTDYNKVILYLKKDNLLTIQFDFKPTSTSTNPSLVIMFDDLKNCIGIENEQIFECGNRVPIFIASDSSMSGNYCDWYIWKRTNNTRYNFGIARQNNFDTSITYRINIFIFLK